MFKEAVWDDLWDSRLTFWEQPSEDGYTDTWLTTILRLWCSVSTKVQSGPWKHLQYQYNPTNPLNGTVQDEVILLCYLHKLLNQPIKCCIINWKSACQLSSVVEATCLLAKTQQAGFECKLWPFACPSLLSLPSFLLKKGSTFCEPMQTVTSASCS